MFVYKIKQQSKDYLSFIVRGSQNWSSAYNETKYYNLDLRTGKYVILEEMLGDNYVELANESIKKQISERQKAGESFFEAEQGGFTGISEDANFYINKNNHPVIVFEKYEIAPGSSGEIAFEIIKTNDTEILEIGTNDETVQITEGYEDNFAVDSKTAKEFAKKVKDVTAKKDLEGLASLTAFPVYVGLPGVNVVETKEDFLKLGAETVFTQDLLESVEMADIDNLQPSMAGFSISDGKKANINFGVVDKSLAINGINY